MDTGAVKIVLVIIALIVLPFVFNSLYKKRKDLKFQKDFIDMAEKEKIIFFHKELWNNRYAVGIDNNSRKLLYIKRQNNTVEHVMIDLSEVEKCRIAYFNKTAKNQDGKNNISDRIELIFTFLKPGSTEKAIEFYNNAEFMPAENDQSLAEKWLQLINSNLNINKV